MPIPGLPTPPLDGAPVNAPTCPGFWLSLNGVWVNVEGVRRDVPVATSRPRSSITSLDGHRFEQRARLGRRAWTWELQHKQAKQLAIVRAAVDSPYPVWLMSDTAATGNMLTASDCYGRASDTADTMDCGGVPLPPFLGSEVITGRVRGGVPTTLACWSSIGAPLTATYPGGVVNVTGTGGSAAPQAWATFTPTVDGVITITVNNFGVSGLMLVEGQPESSWVPGESMPCQVVVDDPSEVLLGTFGGAWRSDYAVTLREVD